MPALRVMNQALTEVHREAPDLLAHFEKFRANAETYMGNMTVTKMADDHFVVEFSRRRLHFRLYIGIDNNRAVGDLVCYREPFPNESTNQRIAAIRFTPDGNLDIPTADDLSGPMMIQQISEAAYIVCLCFIGLLQERPKA